MNLIKISGFLNKRLRFFQAFFSFFYAVGIAGLAFPFSRDIFIALIPWVLLMTTIVLLLFQKPSLDVKLLFVFIVVYLLGFFIEVAGVNTGVIFGSYQYGNGLGIKVWNTPLMIGINWVFLVYCTAIITNQFNMHAFMKIAIAALFMVIYDLVLEKVAPEMDMWQFANETVPWINYMAWFIIAVVFHSIFRIVKLAVENRFATTIFIIQFVFFLILMIIFSFKA